jgi:hypothetical protein
MCILEVAAEPAEKRDHHLLDFCTNKSNILFRSFKIQKQSQNGCSIAPIWHSQYFNRFVNDRMSVRTFLQRNKLVMAVSRLLWAHVSGVRLQEGP